jgi:hypothetical protein
MTLTLLTPLGLTYGLTSLGFAARSVFPADLSRASAASTVSFCALGPAHRLKLPATSSAGGAGRDVVCRVTAGRPRRHSVLAACAASGGTSSFARTLC